MFGKIKKFFDIFYIFYKFFVKKIIKDFCRFFGRFLSAGFLLDFWGVFA